MKIFPATDLLDGRAVRLQQGDYNKNKTYYDDPVEAALSFLREGAECLHIVDLDGARTGIPVNAQAVARLAELPLFCEVGGGIRTEERIESYLSAGVDRVILGTAAVKDFDFTARMLKKYGAAVAVGVDARNGRVSASGWLEDTGEDALQFCRRLADAGAQTVIYTDISRDGMLSGCNLDAYKTLCGLKMDIIASGGVTAVEEITALKACGCAGAIVGKAVYEGRLSLHDAIKAAK